MNCKNNDLIIFYCAWHQSVRFRWNNQEEEAMEEPNYTIYKKVQPDIAVLSTMVQGANYRKARLGASIQGNSFPSKSTFYRHQKRMIPKITEKTSLAIENKAEETFNQDDVHVSIDGRYDSCRNAMYCTSSLIDCRRNKVVHMESVKKKDLDIASNMLESAAARKSFDHIKKKIWSRFMYNNNI